MSKTATKSSELTLTSVDPRVRMKEVRALVANAHKQGCRIDLMGFTGDDIARSQIALQDLLTKEQTKHAKAREHIMSHKDMLEGVSVLMAIFTDDAIRRQLNDQSRIAEVSQLLQLTQQNQDELYKNHVVVLEENAQLSADLKATMNSLRVALNGSING